MAQYFYKIKAKRSERLVQAAFNVSSVAIAVRVATLTFDVVNTPVIDLIGERAGMLAECLLPEPG